MRNLKFKEITILSQIEQAARTVRFHPKMNLILGENRRGKSSLTKSLYYALGAEVPRLYTAQWKRAAPIYLLKIEIGGEEIAILRDQSSFGIFDKNLKLLKSFNSVKDYSEYLGKLLGYSLKLPLKSKDDIALISPQHYFLPFYIDQDTGWSANAVWNSSFTNIAYFKDFRKELIDYFLGIKSDDYYRIQKELAEAKTFEAKYSAERDFIIESKKVFEENLETQQVEIDIEEYKLEIQRLEQDLNELYKQQTKFRKLIFNLENDRARLEGEIKILKHAISELKKDYTYASELDEEHVSCPMCGTTHDNSIASRFFIHTEADQLEKLLLSAKEELVVAQDKLSTKAPMFSQINAKCEGIQALISAKKNEVGLNDIINSATQKRVDSVFKDKLDILNERSTHWEGEVVRLQKDLKDENSAEARAQAKNSFFAAMKRYLHKLDVHTISEDDYADIYKFVSATGSDIPRTNVAHQFALLEAIRQAGSIRTFCPVVIDSPNQQDQDKFHAPQTFKFIFDAIWDDAQLILATVDLKGTKVEKENALIEHALIEISGNEQELLKREEFQGAWSNINQLLNQVLDDLVKLD